MPRQFTEECKARTVICQLVLLGLSHQPLQSLTYKTPQKEFRMKDGARDSVPWEDSQDRPLDSYHSGKILMNPDFCIFLYIEEN